VLEVLKKALCTLGMLAALLLAAITVALGQSEKPRLVVLTDISTLVAGSYEPDDTQSMVRLLAYANEFDIEGLIATEHSGRIRPEYITALINEYAKVRPNLLLHNPNFPTKESLQACVKAGGAYGGSIGSNYNTEGSNWIITVVDRPDPRPVWITVWGGPRELAQAIWKVSQNRSAADLAAFKSKIRVHAIADQDSTASWIRTNHPDVFYITDKLCFRGMYRDGDTSLCTPTWVDTHVRLNHGALGAAYPNYNGGDPWGSVTGIKEGDTPSFLYLLPNGLSDPMKPRWGSWGGRYAGSGTQYADAQDTFGGVTSERATVFRWRPAYQADFRARMDWCVQPYSGANHPPVANFVGALEQTVGSGTVVNLSAAGSTDPDGNSLSYNWYHYVEPSGYKDALNIQNANSQQASFVAPTVTTNRTIHIILTVKDNGTPALSSYKRIVFTVVPYIDTSPPSVPSGVQATGVSSSSIQLTWTASTDDLGVAGYRIHRNGSEVGTTAATSYLDTGLSAQTSYSYTVSAYDAAGNSSAQSSPPAAGTTMPPDTTPPSVPTNVQASALSSSSIQVTWTASTDNRGVEGYKVFRNGGQVGTTAATSYSDAGLLPGTEYSYTVSAYDGDGNQSAQSSPPAVATTTINTTPLRPTDDVYTDQTAPSTNRNSAGSILVKRWPNYNRYGWIEFNLGESNHYVQSATLELYQTSTQGSGPWTMTVAVKQYDFDETQLNWNNQVTSGYTSVGNITVDTTINDTHSIDVTDAWNNNKGAVVTFRLFGSADEDKSARFQDRELSQLSGAGHRPRIRFTIDATPPSNPTACSETHGAANNVWQRTISDPAFTWSGAADAHAGVEGYYWYFGTNSSADPTNWTASEGCDPGAVASGTYYLRVKTKDRQGNVSSPVTLFTFKYDGINPNPGNCSSAQYVNSGNIAVSYSGANDAHSGLKWTWLWYSKDSEAWSAPGLWSALSSGTFQFTPSGDGIYEFQMDAADNADNNTPDPPNSGGIISTTIYDTTPPSTPDAADDGAYTASSDQLQATWFSSDALSGVAEYQYAISTTVTEAGIIPGGGWQSVGAGHEATRSGLSLAPGQVYYVLVKARDNAGNWSAIGITDGIVRVEHPNTTVRSAKDLADGASVGLSGKVVSAVYSDCFYITETDRSAGIRVVPTEMPEGLSVGMKVDIGGSVQTDLNGERSIASTAWTVLD
jgi:chitodextrinase/uncharacterized protein YdeI (BOF family)